LKGFFDQMTRRACLNLILIYLQICYHEWLTVLRQPHAVFHREHCAHPRVHAAAQSALPVA
jgi:hypothetical protein